MILRLRGKKPDGGRTLFDFVSNDPALDGTETPPQEAIPPPQPEVFLGATDAREAPELFVARTVFPSRKLSYIVASGEKAKAQDILAAIYVLKLIERERRAATFEERQTLVRFAGFGPVALSIFPDPVTGRYKDVSWQAIGEELHSLLTAGEYDSAKRTTFNAFYTSPTVVAAMHEAMRRLGLPDDATVLEPGCGTGNFMSAGRPGYRFIGVELDSISGRIAKALHPHQDIRIENFRDTELPQDSIDGIVGNVPFADLKLDYDGRRLSLHDFFLAKSVDALKRQGVMAIVTSHFTLDKQNASVREYLGSKADFIGAIRLPSNAFKREGTAVVADILFMRKRAPGEFARHEEAEWHRSRPFEIDGLEVSINRYFVRHPEMVLGTWSRKDTLYGEGYSVVGNGDLEKQLHEAVQRLPQFAPLRPLSFQGRPAPALARPPPVAHVTEGSFFLNDNHVNCQCIDGQAVPVRHGGKQLRAGGSMSGRRLAALIRLRDQARRVLQSQNEGWPEADRHDARRELNWAYDRFAALYGPINKTTISATNEGRVVRRMPNLVKFREDPDAMLVMSLEDYDEATGTAAKAAIMKKDVVGRNAPVTSVQSAEEGLLISLDRRGAVDVPFIATLYGKPEQQIISELNDLVFHDPDAKTWQTADAYLSGNVRSKLAAVLNAGAEYARNIEKLQQVQPEDVLPGDIDANLGAPWIPATTAERSMQPASSRLRMYPCRRASGVSVPAGTADAVTSSRSGSTCSAGRGGISSEWRQRMTDSERFKLFFGPYAAPPFEYGKVLECAIRGSVIACGLSSGRIPWPIGKRHRGARGRFLIVTEDLERAIRRESAIAIGYWWGVSQFSVSEWRKELGVGLTTEGTRRLRQDYAMEPAGQAALEIAIARAREPDVRAKMGATRRGRPLHPKTREKSVEARKGKPLTEEHRRKIKDSLHKLGSQAPWMATAWKPEEDALLLELPVEEVARRTGRSLHGVKCRKRRLLASVVGK